MNDKELDTTAAKLIARLTNEEKQFIKDNGEMPAIKLSDDEMAVVHGGKKMNRWNCFWAGGHWNNNHCSTSTK